MTWMAVFGALINAVFFPTTEFYGDLTFTIQILAALEILSCGVILWFILREPKLKQWFFQQP